jgi:hypothetical protein
MPVYTVVGTQYCAPRSGFLRLRRGPTRTSSARTLRITSRSKAEAVRMYRKAVGVGRDCELKVYASPESVQPNRRRTSRRVRPNPRRRSSKDYATLMVLADRLSDRAMHRRRKAIAMTPLKAAREHARAAEAHHAAAAAATGAHAHEKRSHLAQAAEHERLQAQYEKDAGKLSPNYAALVRAGAQGAVRLAQSPAVRKAAAAAAPYAIEVAKTGATALQTKLQAKLHRWGAKEAAAAPARVAANRRRRSSRRSPRTI